MSVKKLVDAGMKSKLTGGTALITSLGGTAIYNAHAPDMAALPYVVFSEQTGSPDNETPSDARTLIYWVRAYAANGSQADDIDALLSALLHNQVLTVSGYTNYGLQRETEIPTSEINSAGKRTYQAGAMYRVRIDQ